MQISEQRLNDLLTCEKTLTGLQGDLDTGRLKLCRVVRADEVPPDDGPELPLVVVGQGDTAQAIYPGPVLLTKPILSPLTVRGRSRATDRPRFVFFRRPS